MSTRRSRQQYTQPLTSQEVYTLGKYIQVLRDVQPSTQMAFEDGRSSAVVRQMQELQRILGLIDNSARK